MKEAVYNAIKLQNGKITFKKLSKKFDIDTVELNKILLELKLDGEILQISNKYMIFPEDLQLGKVIASTSGKKYIFYDDKKVNIASNFFSEVILHDMVSFKLNDKNEAEIVTIVDRPLGKMTCEVVLEDGKKKLVPYHEDVHFTLEKSIMDTLYDGDIILVDTYKNDIDDYANAKFIKKIGRRDDPDMEDLSTALNYGFDNDYSEEYLEELKKMPTFVSEEEIKGRHDFRDQRSFTIDGLYSKDMDDSVFAERRENNIIRLYVHIADVSYYVKMGTKIFERACDKTTSLYMNNTVFPMLHHILSTGICSLNPDSDRLTKTVIMDIDENGTIIDFDIVKSVTRSKMKMVYDDVDKLLMEDDTVPPKYKEFSDELHVLFDVSSRLENKLLKSGKLDFANLEAKIIYNHDNSIKDICDPENSISAKIIEHSMIAANATVANWLFNMGIPAIYRILEAPSLAKINQAIDILNRYGYNIRHVTSVDDSRSIQVILDKIRGCDAFPLISQLLIMYMQRARYSTDNLGHYALALLAYLHFTSPIRRLPDLLVHMVCDIILTDYEKLCTIDMNELKRYLEEMAVRSSKMERQADMAQLDGQRRLIIKKFEHLIGSEVEATICDVGKRIRVKVMGVDTYIKPSSLSENFIFDTKRKLYYDAYTGKYLSLGAKVNVRIISANSTNRTIGIKVLGTVPSISANVNQVSKPKSLKKVKSNA